jgi:hypothetical protein
MEATVTSVITQICTDAEADVKQAYIRQVAEFKQARVRHTGNICSIAVDAGGGFDAKAAQHVATYASKKAVGNTVESSTRCRHAAWRFHSMR